MPARPRPRMPIVGGNWKMNTDLASGVELADDVAAGCAGLFEHCDVVVYPPFPYLHAVGKTLGHHGVMLGAQDVYCEPDGAFTGEVSADMLLDLNATMVLVGHSERRHIIGEDDDLVRAKLRAALAVGLHVTLCVGETLEQREAGRTEPVNLEQLARALENVVVDDMRRVVIAYEPVWAIGTGLAATARDAQSVHAMLRAALAARFDDEVAAATRIQYGGSVKPGNAAELFAEPDIDGFLVGGASLKADAFLDIVRATVESPGAASASAPVRHEAPNP
jgi:triosephosphate isomerase